MSLRSRLLVVSGLLVLVTVTAVAWIISATARRSFERLDAQRTLALIGQFHREFELRGSELQHRAQAIADSDQVRRVALEASHPNADLSGYVNLAGELATAQQLEILELLTENGTIISSAHWPARFGYREPWVSGVDWAKQPPFLAQMEAPEGQMLALVSVRPVQLGEIALYVVVGHKVDSAFLETLVPPAGSQLLLWRVGASDVADAQGHTLSAEPLAALLSRTQSTRAETTQKLDLRADGLSASETAHGIPLLSRTGEPLAVLIVSSTRSELLALQSHIRWIAILTGVGGFAIAVLLSLWWASRISRPVEELADAAADVARGNWERRVEISDDLSNNDEIVHLSRSFNQMTAELLSQRDRALQAERVAAWRELARRLAHELKNPLFPLQITVENLVRARESRSGEFDEVFRESTATLLAELSNLKKIIGRFSDFSKMPAPHLQRVNANELLQEIAKLYAAQLTVPGRPAIELRLELNADHAEISGDPDLLRRAFENLILNAIDAMPDGGKLCIRTFDEPAQLVIEFRDTGGGLTQEECSRLFTPYYTTKQFGTGLGLAIVQSVISDHGADISVESEKQRGTTFCIRFPRGIDAGAPLHHAQTTTPQP